MERLYELTYEILQSGNKEDIYTTWNWVKTGHDNYKMNKEFVRLWNSGNVLDWIEYEKHFEQKFKNILCSY